MISTFFLFYVVLGAIIPLSTQIDSSLSSSSSVPLQQHTYQEEQQKEIFHFTTHDNFLLVEDKEEGNISSFATTKLDNPKNRSERTSSTSISRNMMNEDETEEINQENNSTTTTHDYDFYDPNNKFDRYRLEKALNDPRSRLESAYTLSTGPAVATATGTISAISSLAIIYIILNSNKGLNSVYHRIIFGLSCHDIILSIAIAFTTLPMPTNMIYQHFQWRVLGNQTTCNVQGFIFTLGANSALVYTLFLFVYYLLSIRYKMTNEQLSKRIEPIMHLFCNAYGLALSIIFLVAEAYNPSPFEAFCTSGFLPYWCPTEPKGEAFDNCLLRTKETIVYNTRFVLIIASVLFVLVTLVTFPLIIHAIYKQEKMLKAYCKQNTNDNRIDIIKDDFRFTRKIAKEAAMYLLAFIGVNIFSAVSLYTGKQFNGSNLSFIFGYIQLTLRPLQGFFNLCIFVYHKYEHLKRRDEGITFRKGLVQIFKRKSQNEEIEGVDEFIVSSLSIVKHDFEEKDRAAKAADQQLFFIEEHSKRDASTQINMRENKQDQEETEKQEEEGYAFYRDAYRTAMKNSESKIPSSNDHSSSYYQECRSRNTQSLVLEEFAEDGVSFVSLHTNSVRKQSKA